MHVKLILPQFREIIEKYEYLDKIQNINSTNYIYY